MTDRNYDLSERLLNFSVEAIKLTGSLIKTYAERHVGQQLLRSATSAGANYEEACGAESRADFVHKLQVANKELKESKYWLKLLNEAKLG
jgi:four helix bundle protein